MDINEIKECPDCASTNILHETFRDQVICRECGLIFEPLAPPLKRTEAVEPRVTKKAPAAKPKKKAAKKAKKPAKKKAKKPAKKAKKKKAKKKAAKKKR